jgi:hypothetical protein
MESSAEAGHSLETLLGLRLYSRTLEHMSQAVAGFATPFRESSGPPPADEWVIRVVYSHNRRPWLRWAASRHTEATMSRRKKDPLRPLTDAEPQSLNQLSRSQAAPAVQVSRAIMLRAVARGDDSQQAAHAAGRRSGEAVSHLVARFNLEGRAALSPRHGGGPPRVSDHAARERVPREARREPTPEADGTAAGSLSTPRKSLRSAPDGRPKVANPTIGQILHQAGISSQHRRTGCPTGTAVGRRKAGPALVTDPDAEPKER